MGVNARFLDEVGGVEFALEDALATSHAEVEIDDGATAFEATAGLFLDLLLGQNTTVEEHLTALAGAIGDRTNYTMQNFITNNESVAKSLDSLDIAVGDLRDSFASAQAANDARFQSLDRRIKKLDDKVSKGIAGSNALAALKPLDSSYRSQLAVALGGFDGDQAVAIGGFHYLNNKTMINAGVSYSGRNYNSYNIGIVFGF